MATATAAEATASVATSKSKKKTTRANKDNEPSPPIATGVNMIHTMMAQTLLAILSSPSSSSSVAGRLLPDLIMIINEYVMDHQYIAVMTEQSILSSHASLWLLQHPMDYITLGVTTGHDHGHGNNNNGVPLASSSSTTTAKVGVTGYEWQHIARVPNRDECMMTISPVDGSLWIAGGSVRSTVIASVICLRRQRHHTHTTDIDTNTDTASGGHHHAKHNDGWQWVEEKGPSLIYPCFGANHRVVGNRWYIINGSCPIPYQQDYMTRDAIQYLDFNDIPSGWQLLPRVGAFDQRVTFCDIPSLPSVGIPSNASLSSATTATTMGCGNGNGNGGAGRDLMVWRSGHGEWLRRSCVPQPSDGDVDDTYERHDHDTKTAAQWVGWDRALKSSSSFATGWRIVVDAKYAARGTDDGDGYGDDNDDDDDDDDMEALMNSTNPFICGIPSLAWVTSLSSLSLLPRSKHQPILPSSWYRGTTGGVLVLGKSKNDRYTSVNVLTIHEETTTTSSLALALASSVTITPTTTHATVDTHDDNHNSSDDNEDNEAKHVPVAKGGYKKRRVTQPQPQTQGGDDDNDDGKSKSKSSTPTPTPIPIPSSPSPIPCRQYIMKQTLPSWPIPWSLTDINTRVLASMSSQLTIVSHEPVTLQKLRKSEPRPPKPTHTRVAMLIITTRSSDSDNTSTSAPTTSDHSSERSNNTRTNHGADNQNNHWSFLPLLPCAPDRIMHMATCGHISYE